MNQTRVMPTAGWSGPFWEGVEQQQLRFQRCDGCTSALFPPRRVCPHCGSTELTWDKSAGCGSIYTFTEVERGAIEEFKDQLPYVVGVVELHEGFRMTTRLVGFDSNLLPTCDAPVTVVFDDPVIAMPCFRPLAADELVDVTTVGKASVAAS
jgi:uncharacterized OB-fold protein